MRSSVTKFTPAIGGQHLPRRERDALRPASSRRRGRLGRFGPLVRCVSWCGLSRHTHTHARGQYPRSSSLPPHGRRAQKRAAPFSASHARRLHRRRFPSCLAFTRLSFEITQISFRIFAKLAANVFKISRKFELLTQTSDAESCSCPPDPLPSDPLRVHTNTPSATLSIYADTKAAVISGHVYRTTHQ